MAHFYHFKNTLEVSLYWPFIYHWNMAQTQKTYGGFPGGPVVETLPANAWDVDSISGLGRSHMLPSC